MNEQEQQRVLQLARAGAFSTDFLYTLLLHVLHCGHVDSVVEKDVLKKLSKIMPVIEAVRGKNFDGFFDSLVDDN